MRSRFAIRAVAAAVAAFSVLSAPALAETKVEMLNKDPESGERNVYHPAVISVPAGETVTWVATDKGHNVEFIRGAVPDGVEIFRSRINQDASFTFDQPGVYVYKCTPHYGLGMVGIVVVGGDTGNLDEVSGKSYPGKSNKRLKEMFAQLEQ